MFKVTNLVCVLLLVSFTSMLAQTSPSVVAEPINDASPLYYNHGSHVARTSDGKLFVVWQDPSNDGQIVYSQYDAAFQIWSPAVALSNNPAGGTVDKTAIAADDNGNLYCVWQQRNVTADDYAVFLSKYNGTTWSTPSDLTGANLENEEANVAVGNDGKVFVVWNTDSEADGDEWIFCINSTDGGATWSSPPDTLSDPNGFMTSSIEIGRVNLARASGGKMVATWFESTPDGQLEEIHMRQYDGAQWSPVMVVSDTTTNSNRYSHAAVDAMDNIHIVWRPQNPADQNFLLMKHKTWNDVSWSLNADTVIAPGQIPSRPTMVIDSNDNLFVAYQRDVEEDTVYTLDEIALVASGDGGVTWTEPIVLNRADHDAGYQGMDPRITGTGIDMVWREGYLVNVNDPDSTSIVYGHVDLSVVGIDENEPQFAEKFNLSQNFPNPFNPTTQISFYIAKAGNFDLSVYNVLGQRIKTLVTKEFKVGQNSIEWNGFNEFGQSVGSGIYFYKLSGNGIELTKKMVLIR